MSELTEARTPTRTTMQDVAKRANVTIATVSHVINGTAKISPETSERVREAINSLNYHPNPHAQALRRPCAKSIGYLVPDITTSYYSNFFSCFTSFAYEKEFSVSAISYQHNPKHEVAEIRNLLAKNTDAILLYNGFDDDEGLEIIRQSNVPLILLDRHQDGYSYISFSNSRTMELLVSLLKASNYSKIGYISESVLIQNLNDRYIGFLQGMQRNGLVTDMRDILISNRPQVDNLSIGYQLMRERLAAPSPYPLADVFIASSDLIAFGAMRAVVEAGLKIPDDVAIIGCDNLQMSSFVQPQLTTIKQSYTDIAEHAWKMLCSLLESPTQAPLTETLPQQLVVRGSAIIPDNVINNPAYADFFAKE